MVQFTAVQTLMGHGANTGGIPAVSSAPVASTPSAPSMSIGSLAIGG